MLLIDVSLYGDNFNHLPVAMVIGAYVNTCFFVLECVDRAYF